MSFYMDMRFHFTKKSTKIFLPTIVFIGIYSIYNRTIDHVGKCQDLYKDDKESATNTHIYMYSIK